MRDVLKIIIGMYRFAANKKSCIMVYNKIDVGT